jgi:hypothetical protein
MNINKLSLILHNGDEIEFRLPDGTEWRLRTRHDWFKIEQRQNKPIGVSDGEGVENFLPDIRIET